ncbi:unknown [Bacteroides sp. CAG:661]|nr:unknown [Bacteroides sp. CAG:661]
MQVGKGTLLHRRGIGIERAACQQGQAHKQGGDVGGDVATTAHTFVPAPDAVLALQFLQAGEGREGEVALAVGVEQLYEALHALRVRSGFGQPGRFAQQHIFQILILLQAAEESFFALPAGLPSLDDFADARLRLGNGGGQGVGIIGHGPRDGILAVGLRQGRQGLYGHPGRIACHLDGQAPLGGGGAVTVEQRIEAERAGIVALQVEGQGFRHILLVAEHGEDMLLAVAEVASIGREAYAQQGIALVHVEGEADGGVAAGFRFKFFAAGQDDFFGCGVEQL